MSQIAMDPLFREEQQRIMEQMYLLMGKQVRSYHQHRHMGNNSSVPVALAQELMESVEYTVNLVGGVCAHKNLEEALRLGQQLLKDRRDQAKSMLDLVNATAPGWQTECRWEALGCLRHYLDRYDPLHLAHQGPDDLYYPILISPPEGIRGIDSCLFYLKILWVENQIMAGVPEDTLEQFWEHLPAATLNQCEQLLLNGMGKALLGSQIGTLLLSPEEHVAISVLLMRATEETLRDAAKKVCQWLALADENAKDYVRAILPILTRWGKETVCAENIFL